MTRRSLAGVSVLCAVLAIVSLMGCGGGGGGYSGGSPSTPSPTPSGGTASSTIAILGDRGAQSFTPNPASISTGMTFAWKNSDTVTHHIVFDDGSLDSGNLAPGATSNVMTLAKDGARYHCTIHPSMVGSINTSTGTPPPCNGPYCY